MNEFNQKNIPIITIDGPSGVGKGTLANRLADTLQWHFLDSGAMYRLLALFIYLQNKQEAGPFEWALLAQEMKIYFRNKKIYLNDDEVTDSIRQEEIGLIASKISIFPEVREALLNRQKAFAQAPGLIADGRDMGSVVFPNAVLKIYLDADAHVRATRRALQLKERGIDVILDALFQDIQRRDELDKTRSVSPLVVPKGALFIDSSYLDKEQVFEKVMIAVNHCLNVGDV